MPRKARIKSESGIYHIMLRGINQQLIFEDDEDCRKFLEIISEYKEICEYKIYAYCLMGNHIHLLLKEGNEELQQIMKRIGGKYVYWYNTKYQRVGHLFQDRFKSEPVEDNEYLLTVIRYIHQNPIKANMIKNIDAYIYSSYSDYTTTSLIADVDEVFEIIDLESFIDFHRQLNNDAGIDISAKPFRVTDEEAKRIIKKISGCENATEFQNTEVARRDKLLKKIKAKGLSIR